MIGNWFGFGERGRAKELLKLANETVALMERLLRNKPDGADRKLLEEQLEPKDQGAR